MNAVVKLAATGEPVTVREIVAAYLNCERIRLSKRTLENRSRVLHAFAADHGNLPLDDCRPSLLIEWIADRSEWRSDWTRQDACKSVIRAFNWSVRDRRISLNPFTGASWPGGEPLRPMTDAELNSLLRAVSPLFRRVLVFQAFTGCRPCEMAELKWKHIRLDLARGEGVIVLWQHKTRRTQRNPRPREVQLTPPVLKLLIWLARSGAEPEQLVFQTSQGSPWNRNNLSQRVRRARRRAGVAEDCKLYGLRHAFGTRAILNGVDLKTLAELMGHTTTRCTERYVHLAGQSAHLSRAANQAVSRRVRL